MDPLLPHTVQSYQHFLSRKYFNIYNIFVARSLGTSSLKSAYYEYVNVFFNLSVHATSTHTALKNSAVIFVFDMGARIKALTKYHGARTHACVQLSAARRTQRRYRTDVSPNLKPDYSDLRFTILYFTLLWKETTSSSLFSLYFI
jgi:hypothetical protein